MPKATHFHQELATLRVKLLEMAAYTQRNLETAVKALHQRDYELAQYVIDHDRDINMMECEIDDLSLKLLALEQPMAVDLRTVVGIQRVSINLERVGDEAVNIAEKAMFLASRPPLPFSEKLTELADVAGNMFAHALACFRDSNVETAFEVCRMDLKCNALEVDLLKALMDYMSKESPAVERAVHTILVSRALERVGDLSTNIAEAVVFIVDGQNIKHRFFE
ncbi:phosphate signaling complex protein PhoU [Oleidesulfovibrio alaskensis]|jgi:phosphate transport system protein|uniref:phosphate signaling complex protein PhoU n=1 Tax=Oleidesulfovibrio alaskensis TaxID=58180 RepID=UPI00040C8799|nr:phosphate signaling complex protein PhoU [Oleidesulfovibrio alaskensis]